MSAPSLVPLEGNLSTVTDKEWLAAHERLIADGLATMDGVRWDPDLDAAELYGLVDVDAPVLLELAPVDPGWQVDEGPGLRGTDAGDVARMRRIMARLRAAGVLVNECPGWEARGATWVRVPIGVIDHHDASSLKSGEAGALGVVRDGRTGIPGPLSQFFIGRCLDGRMRVWIVAAGRANHAGRGGGIRFGPDLCPTDQGNSYVYGVEKAHDGVGEPITAAAHQAADVLYAAIIAELSGRTADAGRCRGHKEYTPRKIDPTYSMDWRRQRIAVHLTGAAPTPAPMAPIAPGGTMYRVQIDEGGHQHTWDGWHPPLWIRTTASLKAILEATPAMPVIRFKDVAAFTAWERELEASRGDRPNERLQTANAVWEGYGIPAVGSVAGSIGPAGAGNFLRHAAGMANNAAFRADQLVAAVAALGAAKSGLNADEVRAIFAEVVGDAIDFDVTVVPRLGDPDAAERREVPRGVQAARPVRAFEDGDVVDGEVVPDHGERYVLP